MDHIIRRSPWDPHDNKILLTIGDCSHADSDFYDKAVAKTDGYRSQGARIHILASPDLWDKRTGKGSLVPWGSHVLRRMIRPTLQGETYNLQASVEGGDMIRAAIVHIDNKLGEKIFSQLMIGNHKQQRRCDTYGGQIATAQLRHYTIPPILRARTKN